MRPLLAQTRLELALTLRNGESLLLTMGIPVGLLAFFSQVDVLPIDGDPVEFLTPGMVALAVLATGFTNLAIATGFDRSYGVLKRLGATPLGRPRLVGAKLLVTLAVLGLQTLLLIVTALALGWSAALRPWPVLGAVILASAAFVGWGLVLAGRLPALLCLATANALFIGLMLFSGMVFPVDELPSGLASAAELLPSTALADAVRGAMTEGASIPARVWPVLGVWAASGVAAGSRLFRWD